MINSPALDHDHSPRPGGGNPYLVMPVVVLLAALAGFRGVGALGVEELASWRDATRYALAAMFAFTGAAHFTGTREDLVRMVPSGFPRPRLLMALTGVTELAGALGLLLPATGRLAAVALAVLLVAILPANVAAARGGVAVRGKAPTPLRLRVPIQIAFMALLLWSTA